MKIFLDTFNPLLLIIDDIIISKPILSVATFVWMWWLKIVEDDSSNMGKISLEMYKNTCYIHFYLKTLTRRILNTLVITFLYKECLRLLQILKFIPMRHILSKL